MSPWSRIIRKRRSRRAAWLFPLYLVLINLFVIPIALAGLLTFPQGGVDSDMFVLALPLSAQASFFTIVAFIGGLSAATAMVIVETVALAIMVSNDLVVPFFLKRRSALVTGERDVGALLLRTRRIAIFLILVLAYLYYRSVGDAQLAAIGLLSFAAVAQLAPAFFGGLFWRQGTSRGAIAGLTVGILAWAYTLLIPSAAGSGLVSPSVLTDGPFGIWFLRPTALFGLDLPQLAHGVFWSLALNIMAYIGFSLSRAPEAIERVQADLFVPDSAPAPSFRLWRSAVTVDELTTTVARYIGEDRTRSSFESFAAAKRIDHAAGRVRPISSFCSMPSICWPRRSARRHRVSCCRCCCASATCRLVPRSGCSTTPMPRSTTTAKSCRPRSNM